MEFRNEKGRFLHAVMADYIMDTYKFVTINGTLYVWDRNKYRPDVQDWIQMVANRLDPSTTEAQRNEVYKTIKCYKVNFPMFAGVDKYKIGFKNGVLDVRTMQFYTENLSDFAICNVIPHNYNPDVEEQPQVAEYIKTLADNDVLTEKLLYQVIGYPMLVNCNLRTMFLLYGSAQCGKTKFVEYIERLYGQENYSTFDIEEINGRFNRAQICGKLFNYSDDIDAGYIEKPNFLKRLISGQSAMQVENKGKDGYAAPFYAKLILSMNEFPKIKIDNDISAWQSRFNIIHFKHTFEKNPNYDSWAEENLCAQEAIEWVLYKAAQAINEAVTSGKFEYIDLENFTEFLKNNNPFMQMALSVTEDEWQEVYDVKAWFNENVEDYGYKTKFNGFMTNFNALHDSLKIFKTHRKDELTGKRHYIYRIRRKQPF